MPLLVLKLTTVTGLTSTLFGEIKDKTGNLSDASNDETITTKPSAPTNLQASTTSSSVLGLLQKMMLLQALMFIMERINVVLLLIKLTTQ
jgi:hypothetical protein